MFLHSDFGEWLTVKIHGDLMTASDGAAVSTVDLFRDHQVEDLGRVVSLTEWLREIDAEYWGRRRQPPRQFKPVRADAAAGLATRWGGTPADYFALIGFFDKPREFAPENPEAAAMITHNSFGIFLAEELLGTALPLTDGNGQLSTSPTVSTRAAAEDLVYARIGSIPPAGHLAAHVRLKLWMRGADVYPALRQRRAHDLRQNYCGR